MRTTWLTGIAALALLAALAVWLAPLEPPALALQFAFTPRDFGSIVHAWPAEHLQRYRVHLALDMLLLLAYGSFGWLLVRRAPMFRGHPPAARRVLAALAPLAAAFDAVENGLHAWLTEVPRFGVPLPYALAGSAATLKWLLLFAFAAAVIHAGATADEPEA